MSDEPLRLRDDPEAPSELRDDLARIAGEVPIRYDAERGIARFIAAIGPVPGAGSPGGGGPVPAGGSGTPDVATGTGAAIANGAAGTAAKIGSGLIVKGGAAFWTVIALTLAGTGAIWVASRDEAPRPNDVADSASRAAAEASPPSPTEANPGPIAAENDGPKNLPAPSEVSSSAPSSAAPRPSLPAPATTGSPPPTGSATVAVTPASSGAAATGEAREGARARMAEEVAHLGQLRAEAGGNPARALALADEGQRRFPNGVFAQEREAIAISALGRLGRIGEARARAQAFVSRYPNSPLSETVRRSGGLP